MEISNATIKKPNHEWKEGKTNPHDYYAEKLLEVREIRPKLVERRHALMQSLEVLATKD